MPNHGYQEALGGIRALERQGGGPLCRNEDCLEAGTVRSQRGYLACPKHANDMKSETVAVHEGVREIHLKPGMQVVVKSEKRNG